MNAFLVIAFLSFISSSAHSKDSEDLLPVRIEQCLSQLHDIQKIRQEASHLENTDLFDRLFEHAVSLLDDVVAKGKDASPVDTYLLLGECQGVIDSLVFSLRFSQKKRMTNKKLQGKSPQTHTNTFKNQSVSRPNSYTLEPLPDVLPSTKKEETYDEDNTRRPSISHKFSSLNYHHTTPHEISPD